MPDESLLELTRDFGTALLLGALLGVEREKRNAREGFGIAGLRTFVLLAATGAATGFLGQRLAWPWLLPAALVGVAAVVVAGYVVAARNRPADIGLTTEVAALAACLIGAMSTTGHREVAVGLGVALAAVLAYKQPLHRMVGQLQADDVLVGTRLLLATFVVLPLLPDRAVDPWQALNPYRLWLLVLLISSLSLVGYVATRWFGHGRGVAIAAATGGLVSSTAVTLSFTAQSRQAGASPRQLAGGILLAWGVMFGRVVVTAALVHAPLVEVMAVPFGAMAATAAAAGWWVARGPGSGAAVAAPAAPAEAVPLKNPFSLWAAGKFALLFAVVQVLLRLAQEHLPQSGTLLVAALAGLTEVDAITLTMASDAAAGRVAAAAAVTAIAVATTSNTLVKAGVAAATGHGLGRALLGGTAVVLAAGALGLWLG